LLSVASLLGIAGTARASLEAQHYAPEVPVWVGESGHIIDGLRQKTTLALLGREAGRSYPGHPLSAYHGVAARLLDRSLSWESWIGHPLSSTRKPQHGGDQFQFELGLYRYGKREYQRAAEAFLTLLKKFETSELKEMALYWLAESHAGSGEWEDAEKAYRILLQEEPERKVRESVLLKLGDIARRKDNLGDSLGYYRQFLEERPDAPSAALVALRMGEVFALLGRFDAAAEQFRKASAAKGSGDQGMALFMWAEALRLQGVYGEAMERYGEYLQRYPAGEYRDASQYGTAWCHLEEGRGEEGGDAFVLLVKRYPESVFADEALLMAGWAYESSGRSEAAVRILRTMTEEYDASPGRDRALFLLAQHSYREGEIDAAKSLYEEARTAGGEGRTRLKALFMEGVSLQGLGRHGEALSLFMEVLETDNPEIARTTLPWIAAAMLAGEEPRQAEEFFIELARKGGSAEVTAEAWFWVSAARAAQGSLTEASLSLGKALDLEQSDRARERSLLLLGDIYLAQGKMREAENRYRLVLKSGKSGRYGRQAEIRLAETLARQGQSREPIEIYRAFLQREERTYQADKVRFNLGLVYLREGKSKQAEGEFRALIKESPGSAYADESRLQIAMVDYRSERFADAVAGLQDFIARSPDHRLAGEAYLRLADSFYRLRKLDEAEKTYSETIVRFPDTGHEVVAGYGLTLLTLARGDFDAYVRLCVSFTEKYPQADLSSTVLAQAGRQLLLRGRIEEGAVFFRRLLEEYPGRSSSSEPILLAALADRSSMNRREEADRQRAVVQEGSSCAETAAAGYALANLHLEEGNCPDALKEYANMISQCPEHPLVPYGLFDSAGCRLRGGDQESALRVYREIADRHKASPFVPGIFYQAGILSLEMGDYAESERALREISSDAGKILQGAAAFQLGRSLQATGRTEEAYLQYLKSRRIAPGGEFSLPGAFRAAEIARNAGRVTEAADLYGQVITGDDEILATLAREGLDAIQGAAAGEP
jgi:TolA-binding protein